MFTTRFSGDGVYVFSGSEDMNVRVWKAEASVPIGPLLPRQRKKAGYDAALVARYSHLQEVRRVAKHRHVPKSIKKAGELRRTMEDSQRTRKANRVKHSAPGSVPMVPARKERLLGVVE